MRGRNRDDVFGHIRGVPGFGACGNPAGARQTAVHIRLVAVLQCSRTCDRFRGYQGVTEGVFDPAARLPEPFSLIASL